MEADLPHQALASSLGDMSDDVRRLGTACACVTRKTMGTADVWIPHTITFPRPIDLIVYIVSHKSLESGTISAAPSWAHRGSIGLHGLNNPSCSASYSKFFSTSVT